MSLYEYHIQQLCKQFTHEQLAELYMHEKEVNSTLRSDNSDLRSENETLKYLIAKYQIEKAGAE